MPNQLSPQQRVKLLAEMMLLPRPGSVSRVVFFLGAGAARGAGLPLANELKDRIVAATIGDDPPSELVNGRLEDILELFQTMLGEDGYELVAREVRPYQRQPRGYLLLADLVHRGFVEAIITTNFDLSLPIIRFGHRHDGAHRVSAPQ